MKKSADALVRHSVLLGISALAGYGGLAAAQAPTGTSRAIEEITVTAERREVSLQDTAISISAFSADDLRRTGVETSEQLTGFTPGLTIQRDVIGKVVIRGIGTENFTIAGDPGVAISVDGAYLARASVSIFDLFDMERVEVLRGPQGTLYGRNATGGAINFITAKPTDEFEASVSADIGNFSKRRLEAFVSGPLVPDTLLGRISAMSHQRDGFTKNVFPNVGRGLEDLDDKDLWAARGHLTWLPTQAVQVTLSADVYDDQSNPVPYKYVDDPILFFGGVPFSNPLAGQLRTVSQGFEFNVPGFDDITLTDAFRSKQWGTSATIDWEISDRLAAKSLTAFRDIQFDWLNDGDGLEEFLVTYFQLDETTQFSQELQLAMDVDERLNWLAGVYFLRESGDSFTGIPLPLGAGLPLSIFFDGSSKTTAYAVFGEANYFLTDRLRLTVGLRQSYERKQVLYTDDRTTLGGALVTVDESRSWNSLTPKLGLEFYPIENVMLYGSITKGFKSGGFNLLAVQPSYDEEEVWSLEVGTKSRFADGRFQLNTSAFYYDYDDLQVGKVVNLNAVIENAAKATLYGAEIEARALLTDALLVDLGIALLEAKYDEFVTEDKDLPGAPEVSLSGNRLPRAPAVSGNFSVLYTLPLGGSGELDFWGNWQYTGSQSFIPFDRRPDFGQDAYSVFNARISYRSQNDTWELSAYGNNLSGRDYFTNALESGVPVPGVDPAVAQYFVGAPRNYGVRFTYNFGR